MYLSLLSFEMPTEMQEILKIFLKKKKMFNCEVPGQIALQCKHI